MTDDEKFMEAALHEAGRGLGLTSPNPAVGAVIVRNGEIVARGWHRKAGMPHAEIEALRALPDPELARGAIIYVTLEPCSTHGRTPPCVDAIIQAGFARAVVGAIDPNPRHAGRALGMLRAAGIEATAGVLGERCTELNAPFNRWITTRMPWVIAKAGMSLDGRIALPPGEGQWITSVASRLDAMQLRARVDAILIGANTLRADNPRLTLRGVTGFEDKPQPWRVVVSRGENPLPPEAHLFTDEHRDRTLAYRGKSLQEVLKDLGERQVTSVLIEGGMRILGEAFDRRLVDEVCFYMAPMLCGGPLAAVGGEGVGASADSPSLQNVQYAQIGDDLRLSARVLPDSNERE